MGTSSWQHAPGTATLACLKALNLLVHRRSNQLHGHLVQSYALHGKHVFHGNAVILAILQQ